MGCISQQWYSSYEVRIIGREQAHDEKPFHPIEITLRQITPGTRLQATPSSQSHFSLSGNNASSCTQTPHEFQWGHNHIRLLNNGWGGHLMNGSFFFCVLLLPFGWWWHFQPQLDCGGLIPEMHLSKISITYKMSQLKNTLFTYPLTCFVESCFSAHRRNLAVFHRLCIEGPRPYLDTCIVRQYVHCSSMLQQWRFHVGIIMHVWIIMTLSLYIFCWVHESKYSWCVRKRIPCTCLPGLND